MSFVHVLGDVAYEILDFKTDGYGKEVDKVLLSALLNHGLVPLVDQRHGGGGGLVVQHCRAVVATWGATWVEKAYNSTQKFQKKTLKMQNSSVVFNESIFDFDNFQI